MDQNYNENSLSQQEQNGVSRDSCERLLNRVMSPAVVSGWALAGNLRKILRGRSVRSWAGNQDFRANVALARAVSKMLKGPDDPGWSSPCLDMLDRIAERCGNLQAWHLLLPNLDPGNPPVLTMTASERALYRRLRQLARDLPEA